MNLKSTIKRVGNELSLIPYRLELRVRSNRYVAKKNKEEKLANIQASENGDNFIEIHEFLELYGKDLEQGIVSDETAEQLYKYLLSAAESEVTVVRSLLSRLYRYMLKYVYQPDKQSVFWIEIIKSASIDLDINLEDRFLENKITMEQQKKLYCDTMKWVSKEMKIPKDLLPQQLPKEFNLTNLSDCNFIFDFLKNHAHCKHVKEELNIL